MILSCQVTCFPVGVLTVALVGVVMHLNSLDAPGLGNCPASQRQGRGGRVRRSTQILQDGCLFGPYSAGGWPQEPLAVFPPAAGEQGFSQQGKISQMISSFRDQDDPPGGNYTFQDYCGQPAIKTSIKPRPEWVLKPKSLHTRLLLQRNARLP